MSKNYNKKNNIDSFRYLRHFFKSGIISLGIEHFLAMFPATILVPIMVNNKFNITIIDITLVLMTSGIGTLLFLIFTKGKIPAYLGSSFAYIGLTIYLIEGFMKNGISPSKAYIYVGWAYIFAGIFLIILSFICRYRYIVEIFNFLLPPPIVGPAISLIGLDLASTAIADSGFTSSANSLSVHAPIVSIVTLLVIILFSVTRHKFLKNAAIIVGMIAGCLVFVFLNGIPTNINFGEIVKIPNITVPIFSVPPNLFSLFISIIPASLIIFIENLGRLTIIGRMTQNYRENDPIFNKTVIASFKSSLFAHGVATTIAAFLGSVPNTIYTENVAVMGIHSTNKIPIITKKEKKFIKQLYNPFSYIPYVVASIIAISTSFIGVLQILLLNIPKPVIGGIELFLFGIISAPGIQLLVEERINYKKISNQLLTASVLISGISGLSIDLGIVKFEGMSLGFTVGLILNLVFKLLKYIGGLNDSIIFYELFELCINNLEGSWIINSVMQTTNYDSNDKNISIDCLLNDVSTSDINSILKGNINRNDLKNMHSLSIDYIKAIVSNSCEINIGNSKYVGEDIIKLKKTANRQSIEIKNLPETIVTQMLNDFSDSCDWDKLKKSLILEIDGQIPERVIIKVLKCIC